MAQDENDVYEVAEAEGHRASILYGTAGDVLIVMGALALLIVLTFITGNPALSAAAIALVPMTFLFCMKPVRLVYAITVYSFVLGFLTNDLHAPSVAKYVCDGLLVLALIFAVVQPKAGYESTPAVKRIGLGFLLFWLVATCSAILNGVSPLLYLWACRTNFRLFGFLYCCIRLLTQDDVEKIMRFFLVFFWVSLLVSTFQYFIQHADQDHVNGLFGTGSGANAMINVLMFAMTAYHLFSYSAGEIGLRRLIAVAAACCYLSGIAEIKIFYVELPLLIALTVILQKPNSKTVITVALALAALVFGIQILVAFNPGYASYFSLENIIESSSTGGYSDAYNLNRLTAVSTLDARFMSTMQSHLIGLGFGAGQYCQYFASPLYELYGEILRWSWFTDASIFLETGWVGLIFYAATLALTAIGAFQNRRCQKGNSAVVRMSLSMAVLSLVLIVYNCTLTTDPGCYFVASLFSFSFVLSSDGGVAGAHASLIGRARIE